MHAIPRTLTAIVLLATVIPTFAGYPAVEPAVVDLFSNRSPWVWTTAEGDLNGDGLSDLAMIVVLESEIGLNDLRLLVLAGDATGKYTTLSVSGKYCRAQKFFNMEISGRSLFVTQVQYIDAGGAGTDTLQFRFNNKLGDLELIGEKLLSESYNDNSFEKHSINFITGAAITTSRNPGKRVKESRSRFAVKPLSRLNGFECE